MRLSVARTLGVLSTAVTVYGICQSGVRVLEVVARVSEERHRDERLLELCHSGQARDSDKMRDACMRARADRASPLLIKAITVAASESMVQLLHLFEAVLHSSGWSLIGIIAILSFVLPVVSWLRVFSRYTYYDGSYTAPTSDGMHRIEMVREPFEDTPRVSLNLPFNVFSRGMDRSKRRIADRDEEAEFTWLSTKPHVD
jgi:hypothetical protein